MFHIGCRQVSQMFRTDFLKILSFSLSLSLCAYFQSVNQWLSWFPAGQEDFGTRFQRRFWAHAHSSEHIDCDVKTYGQQQETGTLKHCVFLFPGTISNDQVNQKAADKQATCWNPIISSKTRCCQPGKSYCCSCWRCRNSANPARDLP